MRPCESVVQHRHDHRMSDSAKTFCQAMLNNDRYCHSRRKLRAGWTPGPAPYALRSRSTVTPTTAVFVSGFLLTRTPCRYRPQSKHRYQRWQWNTVLPICRAPQNRALGNQVDRWRTENEGQSWASRDSAKIVGTRPKGTATKRHPKDIIEVRV